MRRREFVALVGCRAAACPFVARADQATRRIPIVGVLWHAANAEQEDVYLSVLRKGFADLG
jgi:putative tryptophan/tyrosine transport system substrate-binding protein